MKEENKLTEKQAKSIGTRINSALAGSNKLQKELAKYLNITDNSISYFCSGTRSPNIAQIIKIADFTNVSTDYLLGLSDVSSSAPEDGASCEKIGCFETERKERKVIKIGETILTPPKSEIEILVEELNELKHDPDVALAENEEIYARRLREEIARLRATKKRGQKLREAGVTRKAIRRALGGEDDD